MTRLRTPFLQKFAETSDAQDPFLKAVLGEQHRIYREEALRGAAH